MTLNVQISTGFSMRRRSRNSPKNHRRRQFFHTKRRAEERFGIELTAVEYKQIVRDIQTGGATFLMRQSNVVTLWQVIVGESTMVAIYDKKRKTIKTVLTPDQYKETFCDTAMGRL